MRGVVILFAIGGVALSACSLLVSTSGLTGGPERSDATVAPVDGPTGAPGGDAANDGESVLDANRDDVVVPPGDSAAHCPAGRGPAMLDTASYCIDTTEVTQGQWSTFLAAGVSTSTLPPSCAFNPAFTPDDTGGCAGSYTPASTPNRPVTCINWCDAYAFCKWSGKRMCHGDEWMAACTNNHTQLYPYRGDYDKNACNGPDKGVGASLPVATQPKCEGGFDGLFDMTGNVTELEGDCADGDCNRRGGSFDPSSTAKCEFLLTGPRDFHTAFVGFRCCADRQ